MTPHHARRPHLTMYIQEAPSGQGPRHYPLAWSGPCEYIMSTEFIEAEPRGLPVEDDLPIISKHGTIFEIYFGSGWAGFVRE